jgi:flagellar protein FlaG
MNTEITRAGYSPPVVMPPSGGRPSAAEAAPKAPTANLPAGIERAPQAEAQASGRVAPAVASEPVNRIQTMEADQLAAKTRAQQAEAKQAELQAALERLNQHMRENARAIEFSVDDVTDRTIITVRHRETGEVIRQIPSDGLIEFAHQIEEQLDDPKGLLWNSET